MGDWHKQGIVTWLLSTYERGGRSEISLCCFRHLVRTIDFGLVSGVEAPRPGGLTSEASRPCSFAQSRCRDKVKAGLF